MLCFHWVAFPHALGVVLRSSLPLKPNHRRQSSESVLGAPFLYNNGAIIINHRANTRSNELHRGRGLGTRRFGESGAPNSLLTSEADESPLK